MIATNVLFEGNFRHVMADISNWYMVQLIQVVTQFLFTQIGHFHEKRRFVILLVQYFAHNTYASFQFILQWLQI